MAKPDDTMLLKTNLKQLRLPTMGAEFDQLAREATASNETFQQYLLRLTELEVATRQTNALIARIRQANFPVEKDLESFDFSASPAVNKQKVLELARGQWIAQRSNVCLLGQPGTGKTHLAVALGNSAAQKGYKVRGHMGAVLAALNWAYLQGWLHEPPRLRKLRTTHGKSMKGRPISEDEFRQMLEATESVVGKEATPSWHYVLEGLWASALRLGELMAVSWDSDNAIRPVWNEEKEPELWIPGSLQKNSRNETIPLLPAFEEILRRTPEAERHGWVFEPKSLQQRLGRKSSCNRPSSAWVGKIISRIGKAADIVVDPANPQTGRPCKYASAHDLRRSCAERLREAGVPPLLISRVMRHSSWETTQRHYAPGNIQSEAAELRRLLG